MECVYCGGDIEEKLVTYTGNTGDCVIVIKNLIGKKCKQCGDESYGYAETGLIDTIVEKISAVPLELAVTDANKWK